MTSVDPQALGIVLFDLKVVILIWKPSDNTTELLHSDTKQLENSRGQPQLQPGS